jgi:hypothetical protein
MKAAMVTGPGTTEVLEVDTPTPGSRDVLVGMRACGICGSDAFYISIGGIPPRQNCTPLGHEPAGEVVEVGADVDGITVGDHVVINPMMPAHNMIGNGGDSGALADYLLIQDAVRGKFIWTLSPATRLHGKYIELGAPSNYFEGFGRWQYVVDFRCHGPGRRAARVKCGRCPERGDSLPTRAPANHARDINTDQPMPTPPRPLTPRTRAIPAPGIPRPDRLTARNFHRFKRNRIALASHRPKANVLRVPNHAPRNAAHPHRPPDSIGHHA